jgi:phosphoribosylanthranilate isomerase
MDAGSPDLTRRHLGPELKEDFFVSPNGLTAFPQLKVCGVTRSSDLELLVRAGVDAVGLNLVPSSKRRLSLEAAIQLAARARQLGISCVAVLMDPELDFLEQVVGANVWDFLQLHGGEQPELSERCGGIPIIKAISWSGRAEELRQLEAWSSTRSEVPLPAGGRLAGFLIDAYAPVEGGGTGRTADWHLLWPRPEAMRGWPVILAGGLNPGNVQQAILQTRCEAVDVASGVESQPGIKSTEAVIEFARQARQGFARLNG